MSKEEQILKNAIFIPGEVMSSKNSKRITFLPNKKGSKSKFYFENANGKLMPVRLMIQNSSAADKYKKDTAGYFLQNKIKFRNLLKDKETPYRVVFKFIRATRRAFDYTNISQIVQDLMVDHGWIEDDNMNIMRPIFLEWEHNPKNPGVLIGIY